MVGWIQVITAVVALTAKLEGMLSLGVGAALFSSLSGQG
jgi:hypothetical protein